MADTDRDWLLRMTSPVMPTGIEITRVLSLDEIAETLDAIKERLPTWRVQVYDLNRIVRDLDKVKFTEDKKK